MTKQECEDSNYHHIQWCIFFFFTNKLKRIKPTSKNHIFDLSYLMPYSMDYDSAFRQACAATSSVRTRFTIPVFKIDICANPHYRYFNDLYGYHFWGYTVFAPLWSRLRHVFVVLDTGLIVINAVFKHWISFYLCIVLNLYLTVQLRFKISNYNSVQVIFWISPQKL